MKNLTAAAIEVLTARDLGMTGLSQIDTAKDVLRCATVKDDLTLLNESKKALAYIKKQDLDKVQRIYDKYLY